MPIAPEKTAIFAAFLGFEELVAFCVVWPHPAACRLVYGGSEMVPRDFSAAGAAAQMGWFLILLSAATACQHKGTGPEQAAERAAQTFNTVCGRCHGADGKGGFAAEGVNPPRNFCDSTFQANRTDEQLKQVIRSGKGGMPGYGDMFSDVDLQGLVAKIRSFDPGVKKP